jgi:hypothetical protein
MKQDIKTMSWDELETLNKLGKRKPRKKPRVCPQPPVAASTDKVVQISPILPRSDSTCVDSVVAIAVQLDLFNQQPKNERNERTNDD